MIRESQEDVACYKMAAWWEMAETGGELISVDQGLSCVEVRWNESRGKQDVGSNLLPMRWVWLQTVSLEKRRQFCVVWD